LFYRPLTIPDLENWHTDWLHANLLKATSIA